MEFLDNVGRNRLGDALARSIDDDAKLSIISSYFTVFAYGELREELSKVDSVRFLFSEPTFIKRMASSKDPKEFELAQRGRERGIGGTGLELILRNNLNQRAIARECAEWVRAKGTFKSAMHPGTIQPGGTYLVENPAGTDHGFMGALGVQDRYAARQLQPRLDVCRGGRRRASYLLRDRDQGRQERRARPARRREDQDRLRQEALRGIGPRKRLPLQRAYNVPIRGGEDFVCRSYPER